LSLVENVAATGEIADQTRWRLPTSRGDVFVGGESLRTALTWMPPLWAKALMPTKGLVASEGRLASSAMKRADMREGG